MDSVVYWLFLTLVSAVMWAPGYQNWYRFIRPFREQWEKSKFEVVYNVVLTVSNLVLIWYQGWLSVGLYRVIPEGTDKYLLLIVAVFAVVEFLCILGIVIFYKGIFPDWVETILRGVMFVPVAFYMTVSTRMLIR